MLLFQTRINMLYNGSMSIRCSYDFILLLIKVLQVLFMLSSLVFIISLIVHIYSVVTKKSIKHIRSYIFFSLIIAVVSLIINIILSLPDYDISGCVDNMK